MLSFWNETLKNISKDQRKDKFEFVVNKNRFEVPLSYALAISTLITENYLKDPSYRLFEIQENEKIEEEFSDFLRGKEIKNEIFLRIGTLLKNQEMIKIWKKSNELTSERTIEFIKSIREIHLKNKDSNDDDNNDTDYFDEIQEEIEYIGKHLKEMKDKIAELRENELIYIIQNENISLESEDTIWELLKEPIKELKRIINNEESNKKQIEKSRKMRRILLENIKIEYLKMDNFKEYIQEIDAEDIGDIIRSKSISNNSHNAHEDKEGSIWNKIQKIIVNNINLNIQLQEKEILNALNNNKVNEQIEGKNSKGIIKYLEDKYGKNIHEKGIIIITASSIERNKPEQVIDYEWNGWFSTKYFNPGEWWEINFKKMKVKMNGYSLKTMNLRANSAHLKNWVIEGRNEGGEWKTIDEQNNSDLNGPSYQHYYSIPKMTEPYQFIRIRCLGRNHDRSYGPLCYELALTNFEIYGEINENEL